LTGLDDPIVFQGTTLRDGYEWFSEEMKISAWFRVMTLWQLVNGGYEFGAYSSRVAGAAKIVESHYPFSLPPPAAGKQDGFPR
jgi:hypothetical protein